MEIGLEKAALVSNVDVAVPANPESIKQVRYTIGHSAKKSLEFGGDGECQLFVEAAEQVERPSQWYINHFDHALMIVV